MTNPESGAKRMQQFIVGLCSLWGAEKSWGDPHGSVVDRPQPQYSARSRTEDSEQESFDPTSRCSLWFELRVKVTGLCSVITHHLSCPHGWTEAYYIVQIPIIKRENFDKHSVSEGVVTA